MSTNNFGAEISVESYVVDRMTYADSDRMHNQTKAMYSKADISKLYEAFDCLTEWQQIIMRHFLSGSTVSQIARALSRNQATIFVQIFGHYRYKNGKQRRIGGAIKRLREALISAS